MLLLNCVDQTDPGSVEQIWSWDGSAWSLVDDGGPPATVVTGVAYDPERGAAVRYGGLPLDSDDCSTETWEWSSAGWASKDVDPPTACDHMFMVHDTARDRSLLFGGGDAAGTPDHGDVGVGRCRVAADRLRRPVGPGPLRFRVRREPRAGAPLRRV